MPRTDLPTAGLTRRLSEAERENLRRDGVVIARGILTKEWLTTMAAAVARVMADVATSDERRPLPPFRAWVLDAPLVGLTRQALPGASCVTVYVDQIVGHRPASDGIQGELLTVNREAPYVPVMGKQVVRLWVPLDAVTAAGGAARYLRGSHRGAGQGSEWLVAEAAPGDVVLHHPRTVHGAVSDSDHRRVIASAYGADLRRGPQPADDLLREWESFDPFLNPQLG